MYAETKTHTAVYFNIVSVVCFHNSSIILLLQLAHSCDDKMNIPVHLWHYKTGELNNTTYYFQVVEAAGRELRAEVHACHPQGHEDQDLVAPASTDTIKTHIP